MVGKIFQCRRCQAVYEDHECQCPETGMELCQRCYRKWGEMMAYEMEEVQVSVWHERCWNTETEMWDIIRTDTWEVVAKVKNPTAAGRRRMGLNQAAVLN